jgi:hypothetical protein
MLKRTGFGLLLLGMAHAALAQNAGQEGGAAARIIGRIVAGEQDFLARMRALRPMLETYIQEMGDAEEAVTMPLRDHYMLGRLDFVKGVSTSDIAVSPGFQKRGRIPFSRPQGIVFNPAGWAQMTIPDAQQFNTATYSFEFVERSFLGEVRCLVFDVTPLSNKAAGRFIGRIWVEDQEYKIVRFNGTYTLSKASYLYFHFDSWRVNVQPGLWVPSVVYIEESDPQGKEVKHPRFKAQTRLWGYQPVRGGKLEELANIQVESPAPVRDQSAGAEASPVESQRSWERLAEDNVVDWLQKNGIMAPRGEADQVLNTVANNLVVTNHLNLDVRCRVLLTTPLETFSIGQTIVISRGFLDVLPDEASLAMVLAEEVAHIALGHRTKTAYAFGDQTMVTDEEALNKLRFNRTPQEMETAARKTLEILNKSPYADKLPGAGLFLKALGSRSSILTHLTRASLGNQFASGNNLLALIDLTRKAPPLDEKKIDQIAALPLGSRVKLDPWSNRISFIKTGPITFNSAREKMPFEVTPFSLQLTRVELKAAGSRPDQVRPATSR